MLACCCHVVPLFAQKDNPPPDTASIAPIAVVVFVHHTDGMLPLPSNATTRLEPEAETIALLNAVLAGLRLPPVTRLAVEAFPVRLPVTLPVKGPEKPVAVNNPVFGLNVSLVLDTRASLRDPAALSSLRLVLGAGAPVSRELLEGVAALCPKANVRTPYGMTEVLPITDVSLAETAKAAEFFDLVTVKEGESLADLSFRVYGTHTKWGEILNANHDVLHDANKITAGMSLRIPMRKKAEASGHGEASGPASTPQSKNHREKEHLTAFTAMEWP